MRAVVVDEPGTVRVAEVPDPAPGPGEVVVRVGACGICGTDLHIADGHFPPTPYPIVPGHEFAGEVVALGPDVGTARTVGERVAVDPSLFCGACGPCRAGRGNLCADWGATGDTVDGAFAEYVAVPAATCHRMPEGMTDRQGALVEPVSCAVHGLRRIGVEVGERFLVVGAGTMGLILSRLLRASGARVTVVDHDPDRLPRAREQGAEAV
ncbi:alcohol dehydrogenase catalytic domain-containing protein, partial [Saccharomonospora iraqiensis]|uniref:alcohol dehydrogenase catalytic domain-containing protein n=1 Tax=Saccharomonospora iraqiensis TaxID=52698 RepID=UPI00047D0EF5